MILKAGLGFIFLFFLFTAGMFLRMNEKNLSFWEKLPRNKTAGGITGLLALLAFIPNVKPLFSPEENLYWLIPAAVILTALCYRYLDHLFARSSAGAMILLVHAMLSETFTANLKYSGFFAALSLIAGTYAIFIGGKPYWLRDSFRAMCHSFRWRLLGSVFSILWSISALILLIQLIGKK